MLHHVWLDATGRQKGEMRNVSQLPIDVIGIAAALIRALRTTFSVDVYIPLASGVWKAVSESYEDETFDAVTLEHTAREMSVLGLTPLCF